jgi:hypothetical protein
VILNKKTMNFLAFTLIPGVLSFFYMRKIKKGLMDGQVDDTKLQGQDLWIVLVLNLLAPLIASSIFYYGWKKLLPKKAKTANKFGFLAIAVWVVAYMFVFPMLF